MAVPSRERRSPDRHNGRNWVCLCTTPPRPASSSPRPTRPRRGIGFVSHICGPSRDKLASFCTIGPAGGFMSTGAPISGHRGQIGFVLHDCPPRSSSPRPRPAGHRREIGFISPSAAATNRENWVRFAHLPLVPPGPAGIGFVLHVCPVSPKPRPGWRNWLRFARLPSTVLVPQTPTHRAPAGNWVRFAHFALRGGRRSAESSRCKVGSRRIRRAARPACPT